MMKFIVLFALNAVASAGKMKFKDCGKGEVTELDITDCSGDFCVLHRGKSVTLDAKFVANQDSAKATIKVLAKVAGTQIQVPGFDTDGCKIIKCPIKKGDPIDFKYSGTIPAITPKIKAEVTAELIGDHGILACGTVNGQVE
uniref:Type 2 allergen Lep d 2.035 n=1 Tax=Lepidoglyphus destructor TaxID=36936 RepID=Q1M2N4_LEPDS|nr:type 2 allergen Lep d 2.035 [Lepidoglyphus destructor]